MPNETDYEKIIQIIFSDRVDCIIRSPAFQGVFSESVGPINCLMSLREPQMTHHSIKLELNRAMVSHANGTWMNEYCLILTRSLLV